MQAWHAKSLLPGERLRPSARHHKSRLLTMQQILISNLNHDAADVPIWTRIGQQDRGVAKKNRYTESIEPMVKDPYDAEIK
jgi:hypothetical protein